MNIFRSTTAHGFTLIETLIAILIFTTALVSLMTIAGRGIGATSSARQQITAHYLAQEGLEVVRNIRDSNFNSGNAWDSGFSSCTLSDPCGVVYGNGGTAPSLGSCSGNCGVAQSNGAFVDAQNGTPSTYQRFIYAIPSVDAQGTVDGYKVISKMYWEFRGVGRELELSTVLKPWR